VNVLPLEGIKIVDLSRLAPGPYCTMLLGDLGADVLLIEEVGGGSARRGAGMGGPADAEAATRQAAYNALGRNKRSIGLNLKNDDARQVFYDLCKDADVVLEGFRPGVVKRLGVDYDTVAAINPRIVYCSLSGFGQTGPYSALVGHDINYISIGGALGMIGWPGEPPAIPLNLLADFAGGGMHAAFAIVVALLARNTTGKGQYIDVAMSDGVVSLLSAASSGYFGQGTVPRPGEHMLNGASPFFNVYQTSDGGWFSIGAIEPWFFANLCKVMGKEEWASRQHDRSLHPEMHEHFTAQFKTKTREEWFRILTEVDVCAAPILSLDEVFVDPHNVARGMVLDVPHPTLGSVKQVGIPTKFSDTPGAVRSTAPTVGQNTDAVLRGLGYDDARIAALREAGAAG
jgi:crotonobetainyl-CoA:carnitine CoA-transferase CaiB-like acyl-CoA transferase